MSWFYRENGSPMPLSKVPYAPQTAQSLKNPVLLLRFGF
jgi:hypothetical protein